MVEEIQKKLQAELSKLKQMQNEYHKALIQRQQLDGQLNENTAVKKELDILQANDEVYKLIGPVLVKQDHEEAKENVRKRMVYITSELERVEKSLTELNQKVDNQRQSLDKIQEMYQQAQIRASIAQAKV